MWRIQGIENDSFLESIGTKTFQNAFVDDLKLMFSEISSGKSGSFFFKTSDRMFMIKTIHRKEYKKLKKMIVDYHQYISTYP